MGAQRPTADDLQLRTEDRWQTTVLRDPAPFPILYMQFLSLFCNSF
jgi:hypothetical protein